MFINNYVTPFTITNKMLEYIIKSIHSSLAIEYEVVELTIPDKPTSKNQMYYKV